MSLCMVHFRNYKQVWGCRNNLDMIYLFLDKFLRILDIFLRILVIFFRILDMRAAADELNPFGRRIGY